MTTTFGSFEEFWASSRPFFERLERNERNAPVAGNDEQIAKNAGDIARLSEAQEATNRQMRGTDARLDRLASMIATLSESVVRQAQVESHERRLERLEGTA